MRRSRRSALRRRYGRARTPVRNLDELYDAIDGRTVTYDGLSWKIRATKGNGPASHQPYSEILLEPTAATRAAETYREERRKLGDDFYRQVTHSDAFWTEVIPRLVDDSAIGRR
jgi:hypothetical protein